MSKARRAGTGRIPASGGPDSWPAVAVSRVFLFGMVICGYGCKPDTGATAPGCDTGYIDDSGTCVPAECGTGTWGALELDGDTVYVDASAVEGGDGSEEAPFTAIQEGLDAAGAAGGGPVAVAAGTYAETLEMTSDHADVHLAGRCDDLVTVDASVGDEQTPGLLIDVMASEVEVSGVTVKGARFYGVFVGSGNAVMSDSSVVENAYFGVVAYPLGFQETTFEMNRCVLSDNTIGGLGAAEAGTAVTLRETSISDTQPDENGAGGYGIQVFEGGALTMESCSVDGNTAVGVLVFDPNSNATVRETTIAETRPDEEGGGGYGLEAYDGATVVVESSILTKNTRVGAMLFDSGTSVTLQETTVSDTQPDENGDYGYGVQVQGGATLTIESGTLTRNATVGAWIGGAGSTAAFLDTILSDTQPSPSAGGGVGVQVSEGATLSAESCTVTGNTGVGVFAFDSDTTVTLTETEVSDTLPDENNFGGSGIEVIRGAALTADSCSLDGNEGFGVVAGGDGTYAVLIDTAITSTRWNSGAGGMNRDTTVGIGIAVGDGASFDASNTEISSTEGPAIFVVDEGTEATCTGCSLVDNQFAGVVVVDGGAFELIDSTIERTTENVNIGGGYGVQAFPWKTDPPTVTLSGSTIRENPVTGAWLSGEGRYTLSGNNFHGGEGWTRSGQTRCGDAVYAQNVAAWDGSEGLLLEENALRDGLGVGLFLQDASAMLYGNTYTDNEVDLVSQGETCEEEPAGYENEDLSTAELCPTYDYAICDNDEFRLYLELEDVQGGDYKTTFPPLPNLDLPPNVPLPSRVEAPP